MFPSEMCCSNSPNRRDKIHMSQVQAMQQHDKGFMQYLIMLMRHINTGKGTKQQFNTSVLLLWNILEAAVIISVISSLQSDSSPKNTPKLL